jgi:hypothetical protein
MANSSSITVFTTATTPGNSAVTALRVRAAERVCSSIRSRMRRL